MVKSDQQKQAAALLLRISIITGWVIDQLLMPVLVDQFEKKLIESYPDMNPDEIEFAFRRDGTVVKDWGKPQSPPWRDVQTPQFVALLQRKTPFFQPSHGLCRSDLVQ